MPIAFIRRSAIDAPSSADWNGPSTTSISSQALHLSRCVRAAPFVYNERVFLTLPVPALSEPPADSRSDVSKRGSLMARPRRVLRS
jgi:hypothetical protein